jgi:hypothetical protein
LMLPIGVGTMYSVDLSKRVGLERGFVSSP